MVEASLQVSSGRRRVAARRRRVRCWLFVVVGKRGAAGVLIEHGGSAGRRGLGTQSAADGSFTLVQFAGGSVATTC